ncbi:MAG: response regulator [Polyangiaceae bacterium]
MVAIPKLHGLRILIVDDDAATLALNDIVLRRAGANTYLASSIPAAVEAFRTKRPEMILCDLNLGTPTDGYNLLQSLSEFFGADIVAVALSGMPKETAGPRALAAGFRSYVEKPTTPEALTKAIAAARPS